MSEVTKDADALLAEIIRAGLKLMEQGLDAVSAARSVLEDPANAETLRAWTATRATVDQNPWGFGVSLERLADAIAGASLKKSATTSEADRKDRERWAAEILDTLVTEGVRVREAKRLTSLEAATRVLDLAQYGLKADEYERHTGKRLTPAMLANAIAERLLSQQKSARPVDAAAYDKAANDLQATYATASERLIGLGKNPASLYDALQASLRKLGNGESILATQTAFELEAHRIYLAA
jgi:hypothetical protein